MRYAYSAVTVPSTGYARAAAMNRAALAELGHEEVLETDDPDVIIDHHALLHLPTYLVPKSITAKPLRIAVTTWELTTPIPDHLYPWTYDVVAMPSHYARKCAKKDWSALDVIHHGLPADYQQPSARGKEFTFYTIAERPSHHKNIDGLIAAYAHAFNATDPVRLHIKLHGPSDAMSQPIQMAFQALCGPDHDKDMLPTIWVTAEEWDDDQIRQFHAQGNCYVSLSRGEAFALPVLEAATMGNQVVVPAMGPYMEYMSKGRTRRIQCHETPAVVPPELAGTKLVRHAPGGVSVKGRWLEPDRCHAATLMRQAYEENAPRYPDPPVDTFKNTLQDWYELLSCHGI